MTRAPTGMQDLEQDLDYGGYTDNERDYRSFCAEGATGQPIRTD
jgi:hypothetical protein